MRSYTVGRPCGSVSAVSPGEGHGATFLFQLPSADRTLATSTGSASAPSPGTTPAPTLRGRTILVVEDHDDARELIAGVLERSGGRVIAAASTREAVERVRDIRPDLLLADLGLPGEDGYALLNRFRAIYPDVPAIALTAYARETDRDRALAAGFVQHVIKPVDPEQLIDLVATVISK